MFTTWVHFFTWRRKEKAGLKVRRKQINKSKAVSILLVDSETYYTSETFK